MTYIVQRKDRFYVVAYDGVDPLTGRERRRWHPVGQDRSEAEAVAAHLKFDRTAPPIKGGPVTLGEFLTRTWLPIKRRHVRETTAYRYAWFVERHVKPVIGEVPLRRLRSDHLDRLYDDLAASGGRRGDGLAPKTILEVHMIVRAALDLAVTRGLVNHNVAHGTRPCHRPPARAAARIWNAQELAAFLTAARRHRLYPSLHLAAHTGMRRGEIVGLKWSDLDRVTSRLSVSRTLQNVAGRPVEFGVKTRTSRRGVDVDAETMRVLERWRRRLRRDELPHGVDDWMFCNASGRFLNPRVDQSALRAHRPTRRAATHPLPRSAPHARVAARRRRRADQGGERASRPRAPGVHDAHLPAPAARHERGRCRTVRRPHRLLNPVDVYRPRARECAGQHVARSRPGRRRR
jgi:integrase